MRGFRAWHTELNRYLTNDEFYIDSDGSVWALFETDDDGILEARYTGRCTRKDFDNGYIIREDDTGLKDKNGKEIYEGDILQDTEGDTATVFWWKQEAEFGVRWNANKAEYSLADSLHWDELNTVIGNIHENPELLEGEK